MQECKFVNESQSRDEQASPVNNNNHLLGSHSDFSLNFNTINHDQNFNSHAKEILNSGLSKNSNGFQLKKKVKTNDSKYVSSKNNLESTDDPESSNNKNDSKTTAINSRQSTIHFEDQQGLENLKEISSFSLNFSNNKQFCGLQNSFQGIKNNNIIGNKGQFQESSLNYFTSQLMQNSFGSLTNKLNNIQQTNSKLQNLQFNQPDFSSPTYTQQPYNINNFDISKNFSTNQNSNNDVNQNGLNTNNTHKWGVSLNQQSNIPATRFKTPQQNYINNQEDFDGPFDNESLSVLWANNSEQHNQAQQNLKMSQLNLQIDGNLIKQFLNKNLLGESSFYKKNANQNESIIAQSSTNQLNGNINLNNTTNFQDDDDKGERSSRGLRNLSLKVKQIVVQKVETSYKEVAEELVNELRNSTQGQIKPEDIQKDEQNIKRRVYDALNVLIASKVIEKKGKVVKSCDKSLLNGRCLQADNWKNVKQIEADRDKKKQILIQKQKKLTEYASKYLALMNLIERNQRTEAEKQNNQSSQQSVDFLNNQEQVQELSQRMNAINESISLKDKILIDTHDHPTCQTQQQSLIQVPNHVFKFPLILINVPSSSDSSKIIMKMSRDQKNCKIFSQTKMIVSADLDVLIQMKMHQIDQNFAAKYLEQQFISKYSIMDSLYEPQKEVDELEIKKKSKSDMTIELIDNESIQQQQDIQKNEQLLITEEQEKKDQNNLLDEKTAKSDKLTKKTKSIAQVDKKQRIPQQQTKVQKSNKNKNKNQ